jgi:hypothetical protein
MNPGRIQGGLTEADLEQFAAITQKRAQGKTLTETDKQVLGRFAEQMVDAMEIPENGALRSILKRYLANGEISQNEQAKLREALGEIPDIAENMKLTAHLRSLRAKGSATDEEIALIPKLAGKLSVVEDDAIYATLASLAIAKGISEPAAEMIQKYIERERIDREKFGNKQSAFGTFKRIGLIGLTIVGLTALFAVAPVAALGATGAMATQLGVTVGAIFGVSKASEYVAKGNFQKIMQYGVNE